MALPRSATALGYPALYERPRGSRLTDDLGGVHVNWVDRAKAIGQTERGLPLLAKFLVETTEDVPLKVRTKEAGNAAENNGIQAWVEKGKNETKDTPNVPEGIVVVSCVRIKVEPKHKHLDATKRRNKDNNERVRFEKIV